jgi:hypothetical protein
LHELKQAYALSRLGLVRSDESALPVAGPLQRESRHLRAGLECKCPGQIADFEGQAQLRAVVSKVHELCSAPYEQLSVEDQDYVDAVCVP